MVNTVRVKTAKKSPSVQRLFNIVELAYNATPLYSCKWKWHSHQTLWLNKSSNRMKCLIASMIAIHNNNRKICKIELGLSFNWVKWKEFCGFSVNCTSSLHCIRIWASTIIKMKHLFAAVKYWVACHALYLGCSIKSTKCCITKLDMVWAVEWDETDFD